MIRVGLVRVRSTGCQFLNFHFENVAHWLRPMVKCGTSKMRQNTADVKGTLRRRIAYIFFGPPGKYIL